MISRTVASIKASGLLLALSAVVLAPLAIIVISGELAHATVWRAAAKASALAVGPLLIMQAAMAARLRLLDTVLGQDVVMRLHRRCGMLAVALAVVHPVLLVIDEGGFWMLSWGVGWRITLGKLALLALVAAAFSMRAGWFDYLRRRAVHGVAAAGAILLALSHGFAAGSDAGIIPLEVVWWVLGAAFLVLLAYRKIVVPWRVRSAYAVEGVARQTHDTWTLRLVPASGRVMRHLPGQFVFASITVGRRREEHPFTIASAPRPDGCMEVTVKESGDFTREIGAVAVGSTVHVEGPFGRFSYCLHDPAACVFIAGGVGITPIMSMIRHMRDTNDTRPTALIFGNKTERDIIFRDELALLPPHVKVTHILSHPGADSAYPSGHVTAGVIRAFAGDLLAAADVYVCGPPPMMANVLAALRSLGVTRSRVHYERFAL